MVSIGHLQQVRLENKGCLLLRTPGPVQFGTCICSNVETIHSWNCHIYGPSEFQTFLGTSILPFNLILFVITKVICPIFMHRPRLLPTVKIWTAQGCPKYDTILVFLHLLTNSALTRVWLALMWKPSMMFPTKSIWYWRPDIDTLPEWSKGNTISYFVPSAQAEKEKTCVYTLQHSGSIPRNACVACKHRYVWLPRKCNYRTDGQTDRRRTKWSLCLLCFSGDTKEDTNQS